MIMSGGRNKKLKHISVSVLTAALAASLAIPAFAETLDVGRGKLNEVISEDGSKYFIYDDGTYYTGWLNMDGTTYYLSPENYAAYTNGIYNIRGRVYYFDENGAANSDIWIWNQCPSAVDSFINNVEYDPDDYSVSVIANYAPAEADLSNRVPVTVRIGSDLISNAIPNTYTAFKYTDSAGQQHTGIFYPQGQVRWIRSIAATNIRDLGGWKCEGGTIKYGKIFRGGLVSEEDRPVLVDQLGIRHDIDLRGSDVDLTSSPLGEDIDYIRTEHSNYYDIENHPDDWARTLQCVFNAAINNEPVYFHCSMGADRAGTFACIIEALLGVSRSDMDKDYELTNFSYGVYDDDIARRRDEYQWQLLMDDIERLEGDTFREKVTGWVLSLGFSEEEVEAFRNAMIDWDA